LRACAARSAAAEFRGPCRAGAGRARSILIPLFGALWVSRCRTACKNHATQGRHRREEDAGDRGPLAAEDAGNGGGRRARSRGGGEAPGAGVSIELWAASGVQGSAPGQAPGAHRMLPVLSFRTVPPSRGLGFEVYGLGPSLDVPIARPRAHCKWCAAQQRRTDEGTALIFPSQAAVRQKDQVEAELFGQSVKYHCHSQKVVKERSAQEIAERQQAALRLPAGSLPGDATDRHTSVYSDFIL